jgi:Flp pilus assembly protein TadB
VRAGHSRVDEHKPVRVLDRVREDREGPAERLNVADEERPDQHGFAVRIAGNDRDMIGVGIALIVVGIIFLFIVPWVGIPVGIVGLILAILYFAGFGRRAARAEQPQQPR